MPITALADMVIVGGAAVLGLAVGVTGALKHVHKPKRMVPEGTKIGIWPELEKIGDERAEIAAKRTALRKSYQEHLVNENTFVGQDHEYEQKLTVLDRQMDGIMGELSYEYLPEELKKSGSKIRDAADMQELAKQVSKHKYEREVSESQKDMMHVEMAEMVDRSKSLLAERNLLEEQVEENHSEIKNLSQLVKEQERQLKLKNPITLEASVKNLTKENERYRGVIHKNKARLKRLERTNDVMKTVLEKHWSKIDAAEIKTQKQLMELVQPNNSKVKWIASRYNTPQKAYEYVKDEITEVLLHVTTTYWLTPEEILMNQAADLEDKCILLCSAMRAMGIYSKVLIMQLKTGTVRTVVQLPDRILDLDEDSNWDAHSGKFSLADYEFDRSRVKKVLYAFNDVDFKQY